MGQMTYALMMGCPVPPAPAGKAWDKYTEEDDKGNPLTWIFETFKWGKGPEIAFDEECDTMGFWIAVGASGKTGIPYLSGPIDVTTIERTRPFGKLCTAARKQWARIVAHAAKQGAKLPTSPRLLFVEVEVA